VSVTGIKKRALIVVRTYPVPARSTVEASCTAGITDDGKWIRLFPIPYRSLDEDKQFTKYQWIEAEVRKPSKDTRPESFTPNLATIALGDTISTVDEWRARKALVAPLIRPSMCAIRREHEQSGYPTLGIFRPGTIKRLLIEPEKNPDWDASELDKLNQALTLFGDKAATQLEKLPFTFKYEFVCADASCKGHTMSCTDWEMGQSFRKWRKQYGIKWEGPFRQRYEADIINKCDTSFFVGNLHLFPNAWQIVGLFYPPKQAMGDLFE
jgi:hypothetical protein